MNIFVLNAGSSSIKGSSFHYSEPSKLVLKWHFQVDSSPREQAFQKIFEAFQKEENSQIDFVGHRVVHGGERFKDIEEITNSVLRDLERLIPLAPLHQQINLEGIECAKNWFPKAKQFAIFDTGYYTELSKEASTYPIAKEWQNLGIKKYGFHGISHRYSATKAKEILSDRFTPKKLVTCHLGGGSSISANVHGVCVDTTMGFTPLDGVMMESRPGSLDPGILLHLLKTTSFSAQELEETLYTKSGFMGICGISDLRIIEKRLELGESDASLAFRMYVHRLKGYIGYLIAIMNGIDTLVFSGGIGEHSERVREEICHGLTSFGIVLDEELNNNAPLDQDVASQNSKVRILVIRSREDEQIAKEIIKKCK